jgi:hypothetical protein
MRLFLGNIQLVSSSPRITQFFFHICTKCREIYGISLDSSVGVVMGYGLDCQGLIPGRGKRFFFSTAFRQTLGPTSHLHLLLSSKIV